MLQTFFFEKMALWLSHRKKDWTVTNNNYDEG